MVWIRCVGCVKLQHDFVARTFALIAPVHPILHRVSFSYETIPNAPKHYEKAAKHEFRVRLLEKLHRDFVVRTFALIAPVQSVCNKFHVVTKRSQMHPNTKKQTETLVLGPMGWIGCVRCEKSQCDFVARTFALITKRVSCSYETIPNAPKHYETHQNIGLGSNVVDQVCSIQKITT